MALTKVRRPSLVATHLTFPRLALSVLLLAKNEQELRAGAAQMHRVILARQCLKAVARCLACHPAYHR